MIGASPLRRLGVVCMWVGVVSLTGCGGGKAAKVKGTVVLPAGFTLEEQDSLTVSLASSGEKAQSAGGKVDHSTLTFSIAGAEGKGLAPGKYNITVSCVPYPGPNVEKRRNAMQALFAPFQGDKTPLQLELSGDGEQTITVDLEKKTVTK